MFLSACLTARNATDRGNGDFHGLMEAVARAGVPYVIGYRWSVRDGAAADLATAFYESLWQTLSPGDALLEARKAVALKLGRDDETWAAPVLLAQRRG